MEQRSQSHSICTKVVMSGFQSKRAITHHGRGLGKSLWAQMIRELETPNVTVIDSSQVDGKTWYTVQLSIPARQWLLQQPTHEWYEHNNPPWGKYHADVSEKLYTALMIKWKNVS